MKVWMIHLTLPLLLVVSARSGEEPLAEPRTAMVLVGDSTLASFVVDGREFPGSLRPDGVWVFLFSPKEAGTWSYTLKSNLPDLDGRSGGFTSRHADPSLAARPSSRHPRWWTDDPDPRHAAGRHPGAATISIHRSEFLRDVADRMARCVPPPP
ncbi:MAG: hypothetical protein V4584_06915 [Verrucomicrobiota bacterium]